MKEQGTHEGCIEQIYRLFRQRVYVSGGAIVDQNNYIRLDDWEMADDVQATIAELWPQITTDNLNSLTDIAGYREDFYRLFGFGLPEIDYNKDIDPDEKIQVS